MADVKTKSGKPPLIFRIFGWTFGTLSVLNLIQDLRVLELRGLIKQWSAAYSRLVSTVGNFLFGWIDWRWIRIEADEHHVIVVAMLLGGAISRAAYSTMLRRNEPGPGPTAAGMALGSFLLGAIAVLLLPTPWSLWTGLLFLAFAAIGVVMRDEKTKNPDVDPWDFLRELGVVVAIFAALILVNYMLFPPG